tara:strand:+ start:10512 stop:11240 length:729 start_codon:yes stop_codon:yes gene_type:complete
MTDQKEKNYFTILNSVDVSTKIEQKDKLSYLSWTWAWSELLKKYPEATYEILHYENNLPYVYDEFTGFMVFTEVTIEGITRKMWLPVMNGANKAMRKIKYDYTTKHGQKEVEAATMFDINKTIMRCLVKNIAMFGLGLYIYAGEDLPEKVEISEEEKKKQKDQRDKKQSENLIALSSKLSSFDSVAEIDAYLNDPIDGKPDKTRSGQLKLMSEENAAQALTLINNAKLNLSDHEEDNSEFPM